MPAASASAGLDIPRLVRTGEVTSLIVDGAPFVMLAAEIHNSSSSSLAYMEGVWPKLVAARCNTAIVPLSWELVEPREGGFDHTLVDGLIAGARRHGLRLVFLWFGTYKNADSPYVPEWVKTDRKRFPRTEFDPAASPGSFISRVQITPWSDEACDCDARAFAAVMRRIEQVDADRRTVLMMQVENEVGLLGGDRDRSAIAEAEFRGQVPPRLCAALARHADRLQPELAALLRDAGSRSSGTWSEVFGAGAAEALMAWRFAGFVERVAAAGKAEYALPMFVNCWLVQHDGQPAGAYPSGGPVSRMLDVWRAAAPSIDLFAPDIYIDDFRGTCDRYASAENPLLIPEANRDETMAAHCWYAFGEHGALCFSPFGLDSVADTAALARSYRLLGDLMPRIVAERGTGRMRGILQRPGVMSDEITLGAYRLVVKYRAPREKGRVPAAGLAIASGDHDFLIAGMGFDVDVVRLQDQALSFDFLSIDEGDVRAGTWVPGRRLNGDELWPRLDDAPSVRLVRMDPTA